MSSKNCSTLNRRTFVAGSACTGIATLAVSALGAAATALAEGTEAQDPADEPAVAVQTPAAQTTPAWLGEEPVISADQISRTISTDILIVGAGTAGSAAAATASELGLNFVIADKCYCTPETREYLAGVNTKFTGENAVDKGKLLNEISRYASGKCDRNLIKLWLDESAEMIDWVDGYLSAAGKECGIVVPPDHPTGGTDYYLPTVQHSWATEYELPMRNDLFLDAVGQAGTPVHWEWTLVRLLHDEAGVHGAVFSTDDGYVQVHASHTILATGGYPGNPEMMEALQPDAVRCITANSYNPYDDGSGIIAGIWAGAAKQSDPTPIIFDRGVVAPGVDAGYVECDDGEKRFPGTVYQFNIGSQPFLKVNRAGKRFANESTPYDNMLFAAARQPGGVFCQVFDGNSDEDIVRFQMIGCASYTTEMIEYAGFTTEEFMQFDCGGYEYVQKADTLEELADLLGFVDEAKDTFLATCARYNELYDAQEDSDFGKEAYRLSALRTPPFYGTWFGASLLGTFDGLLIDADMHVLNADYEPIAGLFAIGDCSSGLFDTNYPEYIPGLAAGRSVTEGHQVIRKIAASADFVSTPYEDDGVDVARDLSAPETLSDGTYTASARGMDGMLEVTLEISGGQIAAVQIGNNHETPAYPGSICIENGYFASQILAAQSADIEGVAGATVTSSAIRKACAEALHMAAQQ